MPGQRELKARIRSVRNTGKITGAMRTVSSAKYARAEAACRAFRPYEEACTQILAASGFVRPPEDGAGHPCFLVLTGNRGMCGAYNSDVLRLLSGELSGQKEPLLVFCGRWGAAHFRPEAGQTVRVFPVSDLPTEEEARAVADFLSAGLRGGEISGITVVTQHSKNILVHTPVAEPFAPFRPQEASAEELLFHPSREALAEEMADRCFRAGVYGLLLRAAEGVQGATLVAMRSASDNAELMQKHLETRLNRMRQAAVTTEVIEISGSTQEPTPQGTR